MKASKAEQQIVVLKCQWHEKLRQGTSSPFKGSEKAVRKRIWAERQILDEESFKSALVRPYLEYCVQLCPLQHQKGTDDPGQVQQGTSKMTRAGELALWGSPELREVGFFHQEKLWLWKDLTADAWWVQGGHGKDGAKLFIFGHDRWTKENQILTRFKKFFTARTVRQQTSCPRRLCSQSSLWEDFQDPTG